MSPSTHDPRHPGLLALRPDIPAIVEDPATGKLEAFQNATLRPILKFQNQLLVEVYRQYIQERKGEFLKLPPHKQPDYILHSLRKDFKLRRLLLGMIMGHFTSEEYQFFLSHEKELSKRVFSMLGQRLQSQLL